MAFTPRQNSNNAWQSATSAAATYGSNPIAGNLLVVLGECNANATLSIMDSNSNSWTQLFQDSNIFGTQTWAAWYAIAKAGATTVTVSSTGSPSLTGLCMAEYNCSSPTLDKNPAINVGSGTAISSNASGSIINANELLVGFVGGNGSTLTATGAWTKYGAISFSGSDYVGMEYDIVTSISSYTATASQGSSTTWAGRISTFYEASPSASNQPVIIVV